MFPIWQQLFLRFSPEISSSSDNGSSKGPLNYVKRKMGLLSRKVEQTPSSCLSPRIYQAPPPAMDGDILECPRKKKMFSSSSFYEEPNCIYPTVQEQVKLCRRIAESLSDDCNHKSKGADMFFRRVEKAEKWIVAQSNAREEGEEKKVSGPLSQLPYVRPKQPHHLKLILDPRQIIDMRKLLEEGVDIVEHNAVSPEVCRDLVRDLHASTGGRGAQLFAKRKKKSEEWVVDGGHKVRHLLQERHPCTGEEPLVHPRVKALSEVDSQAVVESVIRAAEAKVMTYPNAVPQVPVIRSLDNPFEYSAPKGWGDAVSSSQPCAKLDPSTTSPLSRTPSFTNFNASPKAWGAATSTTVRRVRPPSVLLLGAN